MRKIIHILCFLICLNGKTSHAQINLVPNPSFEDTINMQPIVRQNPHGFSLDKFIYGWRGKAVYFSEIFPPSSAPIGASISRGVPSNCCGYQNAKTGIAYTCVNTFKLDPNHVSRRIYIQCKLIQPLQSGKKYQVEFYVSQSDSLHYTNKSIGAFFSTDSFAVIYSYLIDSVPQIQNQTNNSLNNTQGWVLVRDTMIANGNEQYMTIGNFLPDSLSDTLYLGGGCVSQNSLSLCESLYYIDDVSVTLIDETGIEEIPKENQIELYPNPAQHQLNISLEKPFSGRLSINNLLGQEVYILPNTNARSKFNLDVGALPAGVYVLGFENDKGVVRKKFVKE